MDAKFSISIHVRETPDSCIINSKGPFKYFAEVKGNISISLDDRSTPDMYIIHNKMISKYFAQVGAKVTI